MHKVIFSIINLLQQNGSKTPPVAIGEACSKPASRRDTKGWGQTFFLGEYIVRFSLWFGLVSSVAHPGSSLLD